MLIATRGARDAMYGRWTSRTGYRRFAARAAEPGSACARPSAPDRPFLLDHEIAVVDVGDAVPGVEQVAAADGESNRLVPVVPPLLVPDPDGEAERIAAFGQRQRAKPADEMLMLRAVVGVAHR